MDSNRRQHPLELKVPPVLIGAVTWALMWILSSATPSFAFVLPARSWCTAVLVLAGAIISLLGVASFRRAGTTVNPMKPASASTLVNLGIYQMTRNPMYLGFLLVLVAWGVFLSNIFAFLPLPAFILYMNRFQIEPEERALAAAFGQPFLAYKTKVRRWL